MRREDVSLIREQLDEVLKPLRSQMSLIRPRKGWIRAVRTALGMTGVQLAKRLGVSPARISLMESGEVGGAVSLESMRKAADALGCNFVYAIVPKTSLEEMVRKQATRYAKQKQDLVTHTMTLEGQQLSDKEQQRALKRMVGELVRKSAKQIWDQE